MNVSVLEHYRGRDKEPNSALNKPRYFQSPFWYVIGDFDMKVLNTVYEENVMYNCLIRPKDLEDFSKQLIEKTKGDIKIKKSKEIIYQ